MKKFLITLTIISSYMLIDGQKNCCSKQKICNPVNKIATDNRGSSNTKKQVLNKDKEKKEVIKEAYGKVAKESGFICQSGGCCGGGGELSCGIGYTKEELEMFSDANLGLGCGHPVSLGYIKEGDTVLDLGSGAGLDCFLAARKVGKSGKVIGVDMTNEMIKKAQQNAKKYKFKNVEFILGDIEKLPLNSNSIDVVMSNCVINLAPNKKKVFQEAYRVLKSGGKMAVSDVVLLKTLNEKQKNDSRLLCACVSGALLKEEYLKMLKSVGFDVTIIDEDKKINKKWFGSNELPISSLKFIAHKK
jgi:arsenite methyltransferase